MPALLLIKKRSATVPDSPGRHRVGELYPQAFEADAELTGGMALEAGIYVRFLITDKTPDSVEAKLFDTWNKVVEFNVPNPPDPSGFRRIQITNTLVSVSGQNGWEQSGIDDFIQEWNDLPDTPGDLVEVGHDDETVVVDGTFLPGQKDAFEAVIYERGIADMYKRRIYYVTAQGMGIINDAGGYKEGTAQQFNQILRSGLDD